MGRSSGLRGPSSTTMTGKGWRENEVASVPSSRVHDGLTFAGVGGFALVMAPPGLLHKGFQDLSLLLGYHAPLLLRSMCQTNAQVLQRPGPCLSFSPFFVAFHYAAKKREALKSGFHSATGGRLSFSGRAPSPSLLKPH